MSEGKVVDIDSYLDENAITIKIKGKEFTVKDLSDETQKKLEKAEKGEEIEYRDIVMSVLGCTEDDLSGYGIVALSTIIEKVTKNLFPSSSQSEE